MAKKRASKKAEPKEISGYRALAKRYDVSVKTIQNWIAGGMPHDGPPRLRRFRIKETDPWVASYRASNQTGSDADILLRRRKLAADAESKELAVKKQRREDESECGNILPRDEFQLSMVEIVQIATIRFLTLPKTFCRHVPKKFHRTLQTEGEKDVRKILGEMARSFEQLEDEYRKETK